MDFALSTCWFGARVAPGEEIVDKALALGFDGLELGYGLHSESVPGISARVKTGDITVESVHSYSPIPEGEAHGHPELYHLADADEDARKLAVVKMKETLEFARSFGAKTIVVHAGRVFEISRTWLWIHERIAEEKNTGWLYNWRYKRMVAERGKQIGGYLDRLRKSLDELLPVFEKAKIRMALENLPSWDAFPQPDENEQLLREYASSSSFACWHDMGHGQVMENAGFENHLATARRFLSHIAGIHIHDVIGPATDHQAPGTGGIDYAPFAFFAKPEIHRVFEPNPGVLAEDLQKGLKMLRKVWKINPGHEKAGE